MGVAHTCVEESLRLDYCLCDISGRLGSLYHTSSNHTEPYQAFLSQPTFPFGILECEPSRIGRGMHGMVRSGTDSPLWSVGSQRNSLLTGGGRQSISMAKATWRGHGNRLMLKNSSDSLNCISKNVSLYRMWGSRQHDIGQCNECGL